MKRIRPSRRIAALTLLPLLLVAAPGCDSADSEEVDRRIRIFVANQGNFADGNGSVTGYDPESGEVSVLVSRPSSIIQSMVLSAGLLYVAMNTGDRIDVVDPDRGLVGQVTDIPSPRYMAWATADRLLVSNLYDNTVTVVDMTSSVAVGTVDVGPNPEGIVVREGLAYVANHGFGGGKTISVIDVSAEELVRTLRVDCDGPRFVFFDAQSDMWTVCTGQTLYDVEFNVTGTTDGAVLITDRLSGDTVSRFDFDGMITTTGPGQDAYYSDAAEALFVGLEGNRIVHFDTAQNRLLAVIGPLAGSPVGAVAFDEQTERLYVGRVPGFAQTGEVTILETDGTVVGQFTAGVAPSHIEILP